MIVSLRGSAVMTWNDTNMRWNETFLYRLEVSQDISPNSRKSQLLISDLQIWADTGAAFLARIGRLYTAELVAAELASEREYEYWEPSENDDDNDETSLVSSSPSSGGSVYSAAPVHGTPFVPASGTMAIARRAEAQAREHRFHREPEPERTL